MASFRTASGITNRRLRQLIALPVQRGKIRQTLIANVVANHSYSDCSTHLVQVADDTLPARRTAPPGSTHIHRLIPSVRYSLDLCEMYGFYRGGFWLSGGFSGPWV